MADHSDCTPLWDPSDRPLLLFKCSELTQTRKKGSIFFFFACGAKISCSFGSVSRLIKEVPQLRYGAVPIGCGGGEGGDRRVKKADVDALICFMRAIESSDDEALNNMELPFTLVGAKE